MKLKLCAALGFALLLAGCKSGIDAPVSLKQAQQAQPTQVSATFFTEVPACEEYQTKMESSSVLEAKQKVGYVFPQAQYLGCKRVQFESFANFQIPITIGGDVNQCPADAVCFAMKDNGTGAYFNIGKGLRSRFTKIKDGLLTFDESELQLRLKITNDLGKDLEVLFISGFVESGSKRNAYHAQGFGLRNGHSVTMIPSNAAVALAFDGGISGLGIFSPAKKAK